MSIASLSVCGVATSNSMPFHQRPQTNGFECSLADLAINSVPCNGSTVTSYPSIATRPEDYCKVLVDATDDAPKVMRRIVNSGQDDGFYVCSLSDLIRRYRLWKRVLPRVEPFYAVKCNYCKPVLETLAACGIGFDCASKDEIEKILSLDVRPERIIFANPTRKISHIEYARDNDVTHLTFDSENELYKVRKYFPDARMILRIKYDDVTAKYVLGEKFGVDVDTEARPLLELAWSLGINVVGVSFHVGSGTKNYAVFTGAIKAARKAFDMASEIGFKFDLLDIGGGFSGVKSFAFENVAQLINKALDADFPDKSVRIISEPGRFYVDAAFTLTSNIHTKRLVKLKEPRNGEENLRMYYLDVGVYNSLINCLFGDFNVIYNLNESGSERKKVPTVVWGATCDCSDKVSEGVVDLPEMDEGDWMVFEAVGAYSTSVACEFNGFPMPKVHYVVNRDDWVFLTEKSPLLFPKNRFVESNDFETFLKNKDASRTVYF